MQFSRNIFPGKIVVAFAMVSGAIPAWTQSCQIGNEIPAPVRTAIESAAQKTFSQASAGDLNALRASLAPAVKTSFEGIVAAAKDNRAVFAGANRQVRVSFLLDAGDAPSPDGRFYCGVFGANGFSGSSTEFDIPGIGAGKYAIVIQDLTSSTSAYALTTIFQEADGWKLAGLYVRPETVAGYDAFWFLDRARRFKAKGQPRNAWFYYVTSWDLMAPVKFMDTGLLHKITVESANVQSEELPVAGNAVSYSTQGKTYNLTDMTAIHADNGLDLDVKYSTANIADLAAAQADARRLADALVAKYPEFKEAFNTLWVHAIDPKGGDVVAMLKLKL